MIRTAMIAGLSMLAVATAPALAGGTTLSSERLITGLARPVMVCAPPGDTDRLFVVEQRSGSTGRIRIFDFDTNQLLSTPFLSVTVSTSSEQGLLGMAFHPDYANNGYFFINYTNSSGSTVISRYQVYGSNPNLANPSSAQTVLTISQPYTNHNGGWLAFSPVDGYLYIGTGDGGSGGDPGNRAQDITNQLNGKMLRIDVDSLPYSSPPDNPFVGTTGDEEIWAYGLRNPWRCAFDSLTGDLYMADVGQSSREEVNVEPAGSDGGINYGWRCYEGNSTYNTSGCPSSSTMVFPVHQYNYGGSPYRCSITGGNVYRGNQIPDLQGTYFFGDYCSNQIWSFRWDGSDGITQLEDRTSELAPNAGAIGSISGFGEDGAGEIYVCDLNGEVFKIIADAPTGACCVGTQCVTLPQSNCENGGGNYLGDFVTCESGICDPELPNDDCDNPAILVTGNNTYDSEYATDSAYSDCGIGSDIWMSYTVECTGSMLLQIQGDFFNEVSAVYAICPSGTGQMEACGESSYIVPCTEGDTFLIRVGSDDGSSGQGSVLVNCIPGSDPCLGDCNGDDTVNVDDVLNMIANYGQPSDCDTNGDGIIDVNDLLDLIGNWGPC